MQTVACILFKLLGQSLKLGNTCLSSLNPLSQFPPRLLTTIDGKSFEISNLNNGNYGDVNKRMKDEDMCKENGIIVINLVSNGDWLQNLIETFKQ